MRAEIVESFLRQSYWAGERPFETIERSLRNSLGFMIFERATDTPVAFCRVVTDYATFAWLCDVFVHPTFRERRLSVWMIECALNHPDVRNVRRWILATRDAHALYSRFGFLPLAHADRWMERCT